MNNWNLHVYYLIKFSFYLKSSTYVLGRKYYLLITDKLQKLCKLLFLFFVFEGKIYYLHVFISYLKVLLKKVLSIQLLRIKHISVYLSIVIPSIKVNKQQKTGWTKKTVRHFIYLVPTSENEEFEINQQVQFVIIKSTPVLNRKVWIAPNLETFYILEECLINITVLP